MAGWCIEWNENSSASAGQWSTGWHIDPVAIVQNGSTRTYANVDSASSEGLELAGRWQPIAALQLRATLTPVAGEVLELDSCWQLHGKLLFDLGDGVQWWLQAENLPDEEFAASAQGNGMEEGVPNRGREFGAGVL